MTRIMCKSPVHPANDFDRFFNEFFGGQPARCDDESCNWSPRADIAETSSQYEIFVELPGVEKKAIELKVEDGILFVKGERPALSEEDRKLRRVERVHGRFERRFRLPKEADAEKIDASFESGLLAIRIAKSERVAGRQIAVS